jgi:hypothetical protein
MEKMLPDELLAQCTVIDARQVGSKLQLCQRESQCRTDKAAVEEQRLEIAVIGFCCQRKSINATDFY